MQFLLDNIIATAIVLVLTIVLLSSTVGRQTETVALADHHANAGRTASIGQLLQRDFESVASIDAVSTTALDVTVTLDVTTMATGTVRYRRDALADGRVQVVRVDPSGAEWPVGPPVADWTAEVLDETGSPTTTAADGRAVRVRMVSERAFGTATDSLDVVWERTFTPALLGTPSF